jgi:hypothetical protein
MTEQTGQETDNSWTCDECGEVGPYRLMVCVREDHPSMGTGTPHFYCREHAPPYTDAEKAMLLHHIDRGEAFVIDPAD